jgi:hypothetical protein
MPDRHPMGNHVLWFSICVGCARVPQRFAELVAKETQFCGYQQSTSLKSTSNKTDASAILCLTVGLHLFGMLLETDRETGVSGGVADEVKVVGPGRLECRA